MKYAVATNTHQGQSSVATVVHTLEAGSATYADIDAYIEAEMRRLSMPGVSLAIVDGGEVVHLRGFGRACPGGEAPTPQTPFFIGSLTKSITALAVMQLVEAGHIELDAPVQYYLPWFRVADPQASAQVTVRHLLNQTSGLPNWAGEVILADFDESRGAAERQARELATVAPLRPPGSKWEYSNSNYQLLGLIIEVASGQPYAGYVQEHIFNPLGMRGTYVWPAGEKRGDLAAGHRYWFGIPVAASDLPIPLGAAAGGGLASTAEDLARYMITLLNGGRLGDVRVLSRGGIDEMQLGATDITALGLSLGQYGMGWFVDELGGTKVVSHGGTLPDFGSFMALLPEQGRGIVLLFNACHHWMNPVLAESGMRAAALLAGEPPPQIPLVRMMPWALRAQLLVPALQMAGVIATRQMLHRWRQAPESLPTGGSARARHVLLPLMPGALAALTLKSMLGKTRNYLKLYMPDSFWLALVCGSFALAWGIVRARLIGRALRKA